MPRSSSHVYRITWKCDWCGNITTNEADAIQMERTELFKDSLPVPHGWLMASSDKLERRSPNIPDLYFDSVAHFQLWKDRRIGEISSQIRILKESA